MNTLRLHSGASIPWIGYGSGTAHYGKDCAAITLTALQSGFTHLDGAQAYENEPSLGEALSKFTQASTSSDRKKLFITTKLEAVSKAKGQTVESKLRESLQKLGLDYVDLYLVHNPKQHAEAGIVQVWKEMIKVKELGLTKSIGVSNFNKSQIKELLDAGLEAPTVNQVRFSALFLPREADCETMIIRLSIIPSSPKPSSRSSTSRPSTTSSRSPTADLPRSSRPVSRRSPTRRSRRSAKLWRNSWTRSLGRTR